MASAEQQFIPYCAIDCLPHGRVLVLAPHPDDEVLGCGGSIIRHVQAGDPVKVIIVTDGAYGASGRAGDYALTRQQESVAAANVLGYGAPCFWALPDRSLEYGEFLIQRILRCIEDVQPDIVYAPSWWEIHPDHLALAMATVEAVRRSARPLYLAMYEVGVPLHPNTLLDVTEIVERKQAAVGCFPSQLAQQSYDQHIAALNRFRTYTLPAVVGAAEAYRLVSQRELNADPLAMIRPGIYYAQTGHREDAAPPLVSVVVRSVNRSKLVDTLNSIAVQSYPNIEILVVTAKGDCHSEVADWQGRYPVRFFSAEKPVSHSQAANIGLDDARGEYLAILDDDHIIYPDHIAALVLGLRKFDAGHVAYTGLRLDYVVNGEIVQTEDHNQQFCAVKLRTKNYIPMNSVLFETALTKNGCRFDETLTDSQDWDFLLQLSRFSQFLHLDQVSACCRRHGPAGLDRSNSSDYLPQSLPTIFQKWKSIWSGCQLAESVRSVDIAREHSERTSAALQSRLAELDVDLNHHAELAHSLEARNAEQQRLLDDIEQLRATLVEQLAERDAAAAQQEQLATMLRRELAERTSALANSSDIIAELHQTVAALRNSTSWKLTKPLRVLGAVLRGRGPTTRSP